MKKFHIRMDEDIFGPYSAKEILALDLLPDIMVTEVSMDTWLPASQFDFESIAKQELLSRLQSTPTNTETDSIQAKKEALKRRLQNSGNLYIPPKSVPTSVVENDTSAMFPPEVTFKANFNEGINSIGGKLIITPTQLIFKAHSLNFGDLSDRVFNITDICGYEKGILTFMYILFKDGRKIKLTVWDKQGIINELEARRNTL